MMDDTPPSPLQLKVRLLHPHRAKYPSTPCPGHLAMSALCLQSSMKKTVTMQHAPSEVFYYTDSGGQSDTIQLSKSSSILQAAKRDLLGIIQLQVRHNQRLLPSQTAMLAVQLKRIFLLQDPELLEGRVTLHQVKAGSVVARQGDQVHTNLNSNNSNTNPNSKASRKANSNAGSNTNYRGGWAACRLGGRLDKLQSPGCTVCQSKISSECVHLGSAWMLYASSVCLFFGVCLQWDWEKQYCLLEMKICLRGWMYWQLSTLIRGHRKNDKS